MACWREGRRVTAAGSCRDDSWVGSAVGRVDGVKPGGENGELLENKRKGTFLGISFQREDGMLTGGNDVTVASLV